MVTIRQPHNVSMDDSSKRVDKPAGQNVQNIPVLRIIAHTFTHTSTDALFNSNNKRFKKPFAITFCIWYKNSWTDLKRVYLKIEGLLFH